MGVGRLFQRQMLKATAALFVTGLVAAGCGSSGSSPTASSGRTASSAATAASTPVIQVKMGLPVFNLTDAPIVIAQQKGYFAAHGVRVTTTQLNGSSEAEASLIGGSVGLIAVASPAVAVAVSKGLPLISVASMLNGAAEQLIASTSYVKRKGVTASSPLSSRVKALEGSEFGIAGLTDRAFLGWLLTQQSLPPSAVKTVSMSSSSSELAALSHGEIDEFMSSPPLSYEAEAQGVGTIFIDTPAAWKNLEFFVLVTSRSYASSNPKAVTGVAKAIAQADKYITSNPQAAANILHGNSSFSKLPIDIIQKSVQAIPFSSDGLQSSALWKKALALESSTGQIKGAVPNIQEGTDWTNQYVQGS